MIKKLRIKFIALTMLSLFIVLAVILSAINIISYHEMVKDADEILVLLKINDGKFPMGDIRDKPDQNTEDQMPGSEDQRPEGEQGRENMKPPENLMKGRSAELPYASRFFWVLVDESGNVVQTNTDHVASVDDIAAAEYAVQVTEAGRTSGFLKDYRFVVGESGTRTRIIFLDCWTERQTFRTFLLTSCGIAALGMLAVFLLIFFLSKRIIRPISESYEKQKRFITDAGHEIKTPLAIIDADAEVLETEIGEQNEWVADIRQQVKRLAGLTNDLIYLSRMEEGGQNLLKTDFSFTDALEETAQPFRSLAKTQGKELQIDIRKNMVYHGDEKSIRQLTSILMDNAFKYSPEGSSISLKGGKDSRGVFLSVENKALNVRGEDIPRLFDRFYRGDASRNSEKGGHGIGLSMARAIAEAHGGKIHGEKAGEDRLRITTHLPEKK